MKSFHSSQKINAVKRAAFAITVLLSIYPMPTVLGQSIPEHITYQGAVTDERGHPVADGPRTIVIRLFNAPVDGEVLWGPMRYEDTDVSDGRLNIVFGGSDPSGRNIASAFTSNQVFLEISVSKPDADSALAAILPRQRILSSPYTVNTQKTDVAATLNGPNLRVDGAGRIRIGSPSSTARLAVDGIVRTTKDGLKFPDGSVQQRAYPIPPVCVGRNKGLQWNGGKWVCHTLETN